MSIYNSRTQNKLHTSSLRLSHSHITDLQPVPHEVLKLFSVCLSQTMLYTAESQIACIVDGNASNAHLDIFQQGTWCCHDCKSWCFYISKALLSLLNDTEWHLVTFRSNVSGMWTLPDSRSAALFGCQWSSGLVLHSHPVAVLSLHPLCLHW